jgi:hypothetical protein
MHHITESSCPQLCCRRSLGCCRTVARGKSPSESYGAVDTRASRRTCSNCRREDTGGTCASTRQRNDAVSNAPWLTIALKRATVTNLKVLSHCHRWCTSCSSLCRSRFGGGGGRRHNNERCASTSSGATFAAALIARVNCGDRVRTAGLQGDGRHHEAHGPYTCRADMCG